MRLLYCLLLVCAPLHLAVAQQGEARVVTYVEVDPAAADRAAGMLDAFAESSAGVSGNQTFQVAQRVGRANHFVVIEVWEREAARIAYAESDTAMQFHDALEPLLISPLDVRTHNDLISSSSSEIGADGLFVVTHVDVFRPFVESTVELMNAFVPASRAEDGNAQFDIWVTIDRANHMTIVEAWENAAARDRHVTAPHTRQFRAALVSSIGALYDERLYRVH